LKQLGKKLIRDLLANKWLFIAVSVVIFLGVAMFGSSFMAFQNLKSSYDYSYEKLNFADFTMKVISAPPEVLSKLQELSGVEAVTGRANVDIGLSMPQKGGHSLVARAISVPSGSRPEVNDLKVETGSYFSAGDKYKVLVEKSFAEYHDLNPGDKLLLTGTEWQVEFTVSGVVTSPEYIFPAKSRNEFFVSEDTWGVVFITTEDAFELTGSRLINEFCVVMDEGFSLDSVIGSFQQTLEPYGVLEVVTKDEQPSNAGLEMDLQEFGEMAEVFPLLFLFVGAMTTYILLTRIIQRQRNQLGLMRAIGYSRRQVLLHYLSFAMVIGIIGSVTGIAAGYFLAETMTDLYIDILGLPYKVIETQWLAIEEGIFIGILPCLLAGILPAWSASKLRPAEAMRTPPPSAGRKPLLEKIFPFLKKASLLWKIPLRNVFRNRRRSISTILGIAFGVVLILASAGFIDTMDHMLNLQFNKIQTYDARFKFAQAMPQEIAEDVATWDGVNEVSPALELPVKLESNSRSYSTALVGLQPGTSLFGLYTPQEEKTSLGAGILLGKALEDELGVTVGDKVSVLSPFGEAVFKVDGFVKQPMGSLGYVSLENAQKLVGGQHLINAMLLAADETSLSDIRNRASGSFNAVAVELTSEVKSKMEDLLNLFNVVMWIMLGFGATLALMVVFTMVTVSLVERHREIATMRTLGERSGRITAMITIENLILGVAGLVVGVPLGYAVSLFLMRFFETDMFSFELVFYSRTYLITVGVIMLIMLLSQIPGIRSLNRLDLARVTKEQVS